MKLPVVLTRTAGKIKLGTIKHAPELLIGFGLTALVGGAVVACKETIKAADIMDDFRENKDDITAVFNMHEAGEHMDDERIASYDLATYKHEMLVAHGQCAWQMFKCYAPAVTLGVLGVASILTGARILKKRELAAIATTAALRQSFDAYRDRVAARLGSEAEDSLFRGTEEKFIDVTETDDKGKEKTHQVRYEMATTGSIYSRIFDASNDQYEKSGMQNFDFIIGKLKSLNYKLVKDGYLFLNDVYKELDFPISIKGQSAGWIYDPICPETSFVKFTGINDLYFTDQGGIAVDYMTMSDDWKALKNDWERDILIDFSNIQDNILEDLPRSVNTVAIV